MPRSAKRRAALRKGYRSGFEVTIAEGLEAEGCEYGYEEESFELHVEAPRSIKCECGEKPFRVTWYTPDFFLRNGVVVECKGRFTPDDRKKILAMKEQHPDIDLRLVFEFDNKLSKKSKTRYSTWCDQKGIEYAFLKIPKRWMMGGTHDTTD